MMADYMALKRFKAVYVVDLCHSLCEQAKQKVKQKGWKNVHVVEGDACTFQPPEGIATLVTFSYSLSSRSLHQCQHMLLLGVLKLIATMMLLRLLQSCRQFSCKALFCLQWCHPSTLP